MTPAATRQTRARGRVLAVAAIAALALVPLAARQTAGPKAYTPPRTADGLPDLQGIWRVMNSAEWDIQDHNSESGAPAGKGVVDGNDIPYQPWALAQKKTNFRQRLTADPVARCAAPGVPRITYMPFPFQIFETREYVLVLYEYGFHQRIIYTDGSRHPEDIPFWMGDSRGRWEGNVLVVDSTNFTDKTWFDRAGNFHSDALHVVERFTRVGPEHIEYDVSVEDPKVFTRPWTMHMLLYRRAEPGAQLLEYGCWEHLMHDKSPVPTPPD